ncbi:hypothetical protein NDU88_005065 [Pleurodeles waltl]|uniref:Uncharacterized protein n=1 Tax=Pleurodeles waltl TaxID=8319 RepID=A0AAV7WXL4_PLEWA|nr:hypothetical protein NDU88_005065 [Pleurodeles waltl]
MATVLFRREVGAPIYLLQKTATVGLASESRRANRNVLTEREEGKTVALHFLPVHPSRTKLGRLVPATSAFIMKHAPIDALQAATTCRDCGVPFATH